MGQISRIIKTIISNISEMYSRSLSDDLRFVEDLRMGEEELANMFANIEREFNIVISDDHRGDLNTPKDLQLYIAETLYKQNRLL